MKFSKKLCLEAMHAITLFCLVAVPSAAQDSAKSPATETTYSPKNFAALEWRNIGPNRGGRSIAVAGSPSRPLEYYFGATGGGLWKTTDGGVNWRPVTDGQIDSSSVGAVAIAPSNPDIIYIGMGEVQLRGNVMQGDGIYRSTDAGASWQHRGLAATRAVSRIRVHPKNPDLVYVAALGDPTAPNDERGIFRSRNGGRDWEKILFESPRTGVREFILAGCNLLVYNDLR